MSDEIHEAKSPLNNVVSIGDISLGSSEDSLKDCCKMVVGLIKDKSVKDYLEINFTRKNLFPTGIG